MLGKWAASKGCRALSPWVHTEGCGLSSSGATEQMHLRTMMGYAAHPQARRVLLLEHGCEKTHNDYMRNGLEEWGLDPAVFGWASVQLDGGIVKAMDKVEAWFHQALAETEAPVTVEGDLGALRLGMQATGRAGSGRGAVFCPVDALGGDGGWHCGRAAQRDPAAGTGVFGIRASPALGCRDIALRPGGCGTGFLHHGDAHRSLGRDGYRAGGYGRGPDLGSYRRASSTGASPNAGGAGERESDGSGALR